MLFSYRLLLCEMKFSFLICFNKGRGSFCTYVYVPIFLFVSSVCYLPFCPTGHVCFSPRLLISLWSLCPMQGHRRLRTRRGAPCSDFSDPFFALERYANVQNFDERCVLDRPWVDPWSVRIQFQALPHMQPVLRSTAPPPPPPTSSILLVLLLNLPLYHI